MDGYFRCEDGHAVKLFIIPDLANLLDVGSYDGS